MEPRGSIPHSQGLSNNPYTEPNQLNSSYRYPISLRYILIFSSHLCLGLPKSLFTVCLPVKILKALLPSSTGYMACPSQASTFNHPDYIRWTVQTMKYSTVKSSPLTVLIPLGPKYSPQDPVSKNPYPAILP